MKLAKSFTYTAMILVVIIFAAKLSFAAAEASTVVVDGEEQPSVSRRMLVCDAWQWIGGTATTWGCLRTPREAFVAGGPVTDQVVASLQSQIRTLEERLRKLEESKNVK